MMIGILTDISDLLIRERPIVFQPEEEQLFAFLQGPYSWGLCVCDNRIWWKIF